MQWRIRLPFAYSVNEYGGETYVIVVRMAHTVAVLGTEGVTERVDTAGSNVEVASDGSYS